MQSTGHRRCKILLCRWPPKGTVDTGTRRSAIETVGHEPSFTISRECQSKSQTDEPDDAEYTDGFPIAVNG